MKEFIVNDYISLKLQKNNTFIYIGDEKFHKCKYLLLNIPVDKITSFDEIQSIDEAAELLDKSMEGHRNKTIQISPEEEFWGHCSNLQVWAEHDYNTQILHSSLAFSILKKLVDRGDPKAKRVFKDEIAKRFNSGYTPVMLYLIKNGYLDHLTDQEFEVLIDKYEEVPEKITLILRSNRRLCLLTLEHLSKGDWVSYIKKVAESVDLEQRASFLYNVGWYLANVTLETDKFKTQNYVKKAKDSKISLAIEVMELALDLPKPPLKLFEILTYLYGSQNRWDKSINVYEQGIKQIGKLPMLITGVIMAAFYTGRQDIIDKYIDISLKEKEVLNHPFSLSNVLYALNRKETKEHSEIALKLLKNYWNSLDFSERKLIQPKGGFSQIQFEPLIPSLLINMTDSYMVADVMDETCEKIVQYALEHLEEMHPIIFENLAWYYLKKGDYINCLHYLKEAKKRGHPLFDAIKTSPHFRELGEKNEFLKLFE